jgi:hypothetical protein
MADITIPRNSLSISDDQDAPSPKASSWSITIDKKRAAVLLLAAAMIVTILGVASLATNDETSDTSLSMTEYVSATDKTGNCPTGARPITDKDDCLPAAEEVGLRAPDATTALQDWSNARLPPGCWVYNGAVCFNEGDFDGTADGDWNNGHVTAICTSVPPPPPPLPADFSCSDLQVNQQNDCSAGEFLATQATAADCSEYICSKLGAWALITLADGYKISGGKTFASGKTYGHGCQISEGTHSSGSICF